MRHSYIHLPHQTDPDHLAAVKAEMQRLGAPAVRVVDCGDHYMAIEGTHRLTAAAELGIVPALEILEQDDLVEADSLDFDHLAAGESYTAGEIAGELYGMRNPTLRITEDGTLEIAD